MPNRFTTDANYRYAFQGQEKDNETGMEAFELRLWDGRIGRWLTVDPYHEFFSPYVGMGNNPINLVDPDGGSTGDPIKGTGTTADPYQLNEVVVVGQRKIKEHGGYVSGFVDKLLNVDPLRPLGSQGFTLDTFRQHTPEDNVKNAEQLFWGVDEYNTGDVDYDTGARVFDYSVTTAELLLGGFGGRTIIRKVSAKAVKKIVVKLVKKTAAKAVSRIRAGSLKEFKTLVNQLSKPGSKLTQAELDELRALTQQHGGTVRVDLTGVQGTGVNPHVHIEGLGKSIESRHIWLNTGVR